MTTSAREVAMKLEEFRDTILNERGALAENGMTNDQINDVLHEFDTLLGDFLPGATLPDTTNAAPDAEYWHRVADERSAEIIRQAEEIAALKHDIARHVQIASEQAAEIAALAQGKEIGSVDSERDR